MLNISRFVFAIVSSKSLSSQVFSYPSKCSFSLAIRCLGNSIHLQQCKWSMSIRITNTEVSYQLRCNSNQLRITPLVNKLMVSHRNSKKMLGDCKKNQVIFLFCWSSSTLSPQPRRATLTWVTVLMLNRFKYNRINLKIVSVNVISIFQWISSLSIRH